MHSTRVRLLLPTLVLSFVADHVGAQAGTGGFRSGDLYLYSISHSAANKPGIVHIDPGTGQTALFQDLSTAANYTGTLCYDSFRDRILFYGGFEPNHVELYASDAAGNVESLGHPGAGGASIYGMTPRGDGLIYCLSDSHHPGWGISYLDASNQFHWVKNAGDDGLYWFPNSPYLLQYDSATNSLIAICNSYLSSCPTGVPDATNVYVLQLSTDGTRVLGESCFNYSVVAGHQNETPTGVSQGPDGDLLLVVADEAAGGHPRMARLDVVNLVATPFATNDYAGAGEGIIRGGAYSHALGRAVIHDPFNDVLRTYAEGQAGEGTILVNSGLSHPGISSEQATLIEVAPAAGLFGLTASTNSISVAAGGSQTIEIDLGPGQAGSLYLVLGSFSGWAPGIAVGATLLPLNLDAYFLQTLSTPNAPPLSASFGALDGTGRATATFALPAGSDPALAGILLHHAGAALDAGLGVTQTTNAVPLVLLP